MSEQGSSGSSWWGIAKAGAKLAYDNRETLGKAAKTGAKTAYENRETIAKGAKVDVLCPSPSLLSCDSIS
jgi:hypothetical protein